MTSLVAAGMEIMQLLGQVQPSPSGGSAVTTEKKVVRRKVVGADWDVVINRSFIEVVIPQCQRGMRRTKSDGALPDFEKPKMPWKSNKLDQDMSDASTNVSLEADDGEGRLRLDTCWSSDGEADTEASTSPLSWQCMEWWMSMGYDPSMVMQWDPNMAMQWDPSMAYECQTAADVDPVTGEWRTTVMIRNMPNNYTREMLIELVELLGFAGTYDFAYLPVDFQSQAGLGYAFINFATVADAQRCFERFEGFNNWKVPSEKVCTVTWSSPTQGLEQHIERYKNSPVMHHSIPDEWKPILIQQGMRINFPPPSKPLKTPKVRQHPSGRETTTQFQ